MKIAYIGWGSLIWNQGSLKIQDSWQDDGPLIPVEFARISQDGRLTLVLWRGASPVQTLWSYAAEENLNAAIKGLKLREGTNANRIGYLSLRNGKSRCQVIEDLVVIIESWLRDKDLDAAVWTDLPSNFEQKTGKAFTTESAVAYLKSLEGNALDAARTYIVNAPDSINTPIKRAVEEELGWKRS
jgi:hypothetical protein